MAASNPKPAAVPASFGTLPASVQPRYENVTPTNFDDEAYEEEYDEYAGYEDDEEDEDEEDEEEAGFGDQYEYPAEDTLPHPVAGKHYMLQVNLFRYTQHVTDKHDIYR